MLQFLAIRSWAYTRVYYYKNAITLHTRRDLTCIRRISGQTRVFICMQSRRYYRIMKLRSMHARLANRTLHIHNSPEFLHKGRRLTEPPVITKDFFQPFLLAESFRLLVCAHCNGPCLFFSTLERVTKFTLFFDPSIVRLDVAC